MTGNFLSFLFQYGIIGSLWLRGSLFMYFQGLVVRMKETSDETDEGMWLNIGNCYSDISKIFPQHQIEISFSLFMYPYLI